MSAGVTWVAIAAFGLSVVSLGWQILAATRRRPRIKVGLEREPHYAQFNSEDEMVTPDRCSIHVTVQNPGAESIWINDVGVVSEGIVLGLRGRRQSVRLRIGVGGIGDIHQVDGSTKQITLPTQISGREHVRFTVPDQMTKPHGDSKVWTGFAELYRAGKEPRRILSKERAARLQ